MLSLIVVGYFRDPQARSDSWQWPLFDFRIIKAFFFCNAQGAHWWSAISAMAIGVPVSSATPPPVTGKTWTMWMMWFILQAFKSYVWFITWTTTICQPRWNMKVETSQSPRLQKKERDQLALVLQKGRLTFDGVLELNTLLPKYSTLVPLRMVEICPNKTNLNIISHNTWELWRLSTRN